MPRPGSRTASSPTRTTCCSTARTPSSDTTGSTTSTTTTSSSAGRRGTTANPRLRRFWGPVHFPVVEDLRLADGSSARNRGVELTDPVLRDIDGNPPRGNARTAAATPSARPRWRWESMACAPSPDGIIHSDMPTMESRIVAGRADPGPATPARRSHQCRRWTAARPRSGRRSTVCFGVFFRRWGTPARRAGAGCVHIGRVRVRAGEAHRVIFMSTDRGTLGRITHEGRTAVWILPSCRSSWPSPTRPAAQARKQPAAPTPTASTPTSPTIHDRPHGTPEASTPPRSVRSGPCWGSTRARGAELGPAGADRHRSSPRVPPPQVDGLPESVRDLEPVAHFITGNDTPKQRRQTTSCDVTRDLIRALRPGPDRANAGAFAVGLAHVPITCGTRFRRTTFSQCGTWGVTCSAATLRAGAINGAAATKSASVWPGRTRTVKETGGPRSM